MSEGVKQMPWQVSRSLNTKECEVNLSAWLSRSKRNSSVRLFCHLWVRSDFEYAHHKANSCPLKCFSSPYNQWFCLSAKLTGLNSAHLIMQMLWKSTGCIQVVFRSRQYSWEYLQRSFVSVGAWRTSYWSPPSWQDNCNQCLWRMTERGTQGKQSVTGRSTRRIKRW